MATTWTEDTAVSEAASLKGWARVAKAVCTTGSESAPSASSSEGLMLVGVATYMVYLESASGAFAGGTLECYLQNLLSGKWNRRQDMDLTVGALTNECFGGFEVDARFGRLAFVPQGLGVGSTIYIVGRLER